MDVSARVPARMGAAVLSAVREMQWREVPCPAPHEDELLVRVLATGICGSDVATYVGTHPYKSPPAVLGHEFCGEVHAVGAAVTGFRPGDKVCTMAFSPCQRCGPCVRGAVNLCRDRGNLSHDGWAGSFAEYVVTHPNMTFHLPPDLDPTVGALVEPMAIGRHAVALAGSGDGRPVAVLGLGPVGLACSLAAREAGFGPITGVDLGPDKGALGARIGVQHYVDGDMVDPVAAVRAQLTGPAQVTVVAAGYPGVLEQAAAVTAAGGVVVVVSYFPDTPTVDANRIVGAELTVQGSALCTPADVREVVGWIADGRVRPGTMVTHRYPLSEAATAMAFAAGAHRHTGKVLLEVPSSASAEKGDDRGLGIGHRSGRRC